jgi:hypothetical protein
VHVSLSRARTRSLTVLLAIVVVALAAAIATPTAKGGTAPTWSYEEGMGGSAPFSFVAPLDSQLLTIGTDQSLSFQVTDAALAARPPGDQNDNQITVSATTSQIDLSMPAGPGTLKDFLTFGGVLSTTVRGVSVALSYNIDGRTAGGELQWSVPLNGSPGPFTEVLGAYTGGHTIAYQVRFTAPATVMTAPVVLNDVVIGYGPYHKPPKSKGGGGGTGHNKDKSGGDKGKPAANTGRGSGSGAGNGSTMGNGSGAGGSGTSGSDVKQSTSATSGAGSQPTPDVHKASSKARSARAATDAPVTSPATGGSAVVQGYAVVASAALGADGAAVGTASAAAGGGRSVGGGTGFGVGDTYLVFGAAIVGLLLLPVPFVARRLRRVAEYDHEAAAGRWYGDAAR